MGGLTSKGKNVIHTEMGIRWLISVIVQKMRIRDNGKKE